MCPWVQYPGFGGRPSTLCLSCIPSHESFKYVHHTQDIHCSERNGLTFVYVVSSAWDSPSLVASYRVSRPRELGGTEVGIWGTDPDGAPLISALTSAGWSPHTTALEERLPPLITDWLPLFPLWFAASGRVSRTGLRVLLRPLEHQLHKGNGKADFPGQDLAGIWVEAMQARTALEGGVRKQVQLGNGLSPGPLAQPGGPWVRRGLSLW